MKRTSIFRTMFSVFLLIITISIGTSALYSVTTFKNFIKNTESDNLIESTEMLRDLFPIDDFANNTVINKFTESGRNKSIRITVVKNDGKVLADSIEDPSTMDNHLYRPEIKATFNGEKTTLSRYSSTLEKMMIYYSLPIEKDGEVLGYLRTAISVELLNRRVRVVGITISIISIILIIISIGISYLLALRFSFSINSIKSVAAFYAKGEFEKTLPERGYNEFASLSKSINIMGNSLQERIFKTVEQKNRYKSMLESMREPVIRLNSAIIIEEMNRAAEILFNIADSGSKGMGLLEVTKNEKLFAFVKNSMNMTGNSEAMVQFSGDSETHLQVHSSVLYDGDKKKIGMLLVMNDLTDHIRLEEMRKEFVANVSHELRTPTTAIQGYIETLINNEVSREQVDKFLGIIYSHSIRLTSIIDDLLSLAGLEKSNGSFIFESFPVVDLISSTLNTVSVKATKKNISVEVYSSERHKIYAHPLLAEQALTNLLVNAIKYSDEGSLIEIKTFTKREGITIEVSDQGCGISVEDQEQVFERFYRVDRARSREQGGTGLGLSIVKRVMSIHGGQASLQSEVNIGSVFRLFFPVE